MSIIIVNFEPGMRSNAFFVTSLLLQVISFGNKNVNFFFFFISNGNDITV